MVDRYHSTIREETALPVDEVLRQPVPARVHALVYIETLDRPSVQAVAFARAARPHVLEAVTVDTVPEQTKALRGEWGSRDMPITLRILEAPYREEVRPIIDYVGRLHRDRPRDVIVVYIPEYVGAKRHLPWFRDRARERLRNELLRTPGVMVVSVPWQGKGVRPSDGTKDPETIDAVTEPDSTHTVSHD